MTGRDAAGLLWVAQPCPVNAGARDAPALDGGAIPPGRTSLLVVREIREKWVRPGWTPSEGPPAALELSLRLDRPNPGPDQGVPVPAPAAVDKVFPCPSQVVATYNNRTVAIGETYAGPRATVQFIYTNGATSTLGIGFSVSGSYGSFTSSGTATVSSTTVSQWPVMGTNSRTIYQTTFQYKKFEEWVWNGYSCQRWGYEVRPTAYEGAATHYTPCCIPTATYCSAIFGGVTVTKDTAKAVTWSDAVKIGSDIGINLSGSTGYNFATKVTWKFLSNGQLCGSNASYPNAARVVGK